VLIALGLVVGVGCLAADYQSSEMFNRYMEVATILGVALFSTTLISTAERLRVLVWVIAMSFGFYGVKVGLSGVLSGGNLQVLRGPGGMLEDNNDFSLALCMALPLLIHIGSSEKRAVLRRGVWLMVPLTMLTVIMTHSRGGFLSLVACMGVLTWRSRNRVAGFSLAFVAAIVAILVVPQSYIDRIKSIEHYEQDGSAMGRLAAWTVAVKMASAHPVLGVGFTNFRRHYHEYSQPGEFVRVAHNSYLQVWAETGTLCLALYLFLIFYTVWRLWLLRREARRYFNTSWILNYTTMFEASFIAFAVGGTFLNRAAFDLFYHFVGIVIAFEMIAYREMARLELRQPDPHQLDFGEGQVSTEPAFGFGRKQRRSGFVTRPLLGDNR
jgi:probable O-glycosylation ligase (exosortase A-associated)